MNGTLVTVVPLAELVAELQDYWLNELGFSDLIEVLTPDRIMEEIQHVAKVAIHRNHIRPLDYLDRTKTLLCQAKGCFSDYAASLVDEMYLRVRDELPSGIASAKHIYAVDLRAGILYIHLLVTCEAFAYGIDPQTLIDQVI